MADPTRSKSGTTRPAAAAYAAFDSQSVTRDSSSSCAGRARTLRSLAVSWRSLCSEAPGRVGDLGVGVPGSLQDERLALIGRQLGDQPRPAFGLQALFDAVLAPDELLVHDRVIIEVLGAPER